MIVITGATGQLGQIVIEKLLKTQNPSNVVAAVRNPQKAESLVKAGVQVRTADYGKPETLREAFKGATQILLISSSEVGQRFTQHKAVIEAAQEAKVKQIVYTSILKADTSRLGLAAEHLQTEKLIQQSGLSYTILRNGWYLENHTDNLNPALEYGVIMGSAKDGLFSSASRADFAAAAVAVLTTSGHENKIYELAGDAAFTLSDLAKAVCEKSGREVIYKDMPMGDYEKALIGVGVPAPFANLLADSDVGASLGDLHSNSHDLSRLIGRATTTLDTDLARVLKK